MDQREHSIPSEGPGYPASTADVESQIPSRRWRSQFVYVGLFTGLSGATVAIGLMALGGPLWLATILGPALGGLLAAVICPHRTLTELDADYRAINHLERTLRQLSFEGRRAPMSSVLVDRPGIVGALSRAIHARLIEALAQHAEVRLLKRTIDVTIERRTKLATADLSRLARTDPLTGLGNRRALEEAIIDLYQHRATPRIAVSVMLIDLDHFKTINDTLGHDTGDEILRHLADCLLSTLRCDDVPARLGGDEFIVLLPGVSERDARRVAERIRQLFHQMPWRDSTVPRATLSIGIATAREEQPCPPSTLLRRADQALYAAKRDGRNTTRSAGESDHTMAVA